MPFTQGSEQDRREWQLWLSVSSAIVQASLRHVSTLVTWVMQLTPSIANYGAASVAKLT